MCKMLVIFMISGVIANRTEAVASIELLGGVSETYAQASSHHQYFSAGRAVDGNPDSAWILDKRQGWIKVSLGLLTALDQVVINQVGDRIQTMCIEAYDGARWNEVYQGSAQSGRGVYSITPIEASALRISVQKKDGANNIALSEIKAYHTAGGKPSYRGHPVITPRNIPTGKKSTRYVGFSGVHLVQGSNHAAWLKYYGVNGARLWYTAGLFIPESDLSLGEKVTDLMSFDERKKDFRRSLRKDPDDNGYIHWDPSKFSDWRRYSQGHSDINYSLKTMKKLEITPVVMLNCGYFGDDWDENWRRWLQIYGMVFYMAKNFDVTMYQYANEPEGRMRQLGMTEGAFVRSLQIHSDAIHSAIEDVNALYGKSLKPRWDAPVTASDPTRKRDCDTGMPAAGRWMMENIRTDLCGNTVDYDIVNIFSNHIYPTRPYECQNRIHALQTMMKEESPTGNMLPIILSEFNYSTTGNWNRPHIRYTGDTPKVVQSMASTWGLLMELGIYGMYQFRYSQNPYRNNNAVNHDFLIAKDPEANIAMNKPVIASSQSAEHPATNVVDGNYTEESVWRSAPDKDGPQTLEIDLGKIYDIQTVMIYTGNEIKHEGQSGNVVDNYKVQAEIDGQWVSISRSTNNKNHHNGHFNLLQLQPGQISTRKIRFYSDESGPLMVRGIYVSEKPHIRNIGGATRNAEVTRLFAEGFKGARNLYETEIQCADLNYKVFTSHDSDTGRYYLWSVQPNDAQDYHLTIDLNELGIDAGSLFIVKEVSEDHHGEIVHQQAVPSSKRIQLTQPATSVWLISVCKNKPTKTHKIEPSDQTYVAMGSRRHDNYQDEPRLKVRRSDNLDDNYVTYMKFNLRDVDRAHLNRAMLSIYGQRHYLEQDSVKKTSNLYGTDYRIRVYGIEDHNWSEETLTAATAPNLYRQVSAVKGIDLNNRPVAHMTFIEAGNYSHVDVTDYLKQHNGEDVTFVFIKESRHTLDYVDSHYVELHSKKSLAHKPFLSLYTQVD